MSDHRMDPHGLSRPAASTATGGLLPAADDASTVSRRGFLIAAAMVAPALAAGRLLAQDVPGASMEGDGYVPVSRPPKPGAEPSMTPNERDALERRLACPCPCTLDIFTCRTSMPTCGFSPRIHRDVLRLVDGGYSASEIMATFKDAYGDHILMAPPKQGFNLVGWFAPFTLIGAGAVGILALLRSWRRPEAAAATSDVHPIGVDASADELARLEAAVRRDEP